MKLVVLCSHYPPLLSPESAHSMMLCERLAQSGMEVDLITSVLPEGYPAPQGFRVHPVMQGWGWRDLPRLRRMIRLLKPEVILLIYVGWIYHAHPMITFGPTWLRWIAPSVPFVAQFENVAPAAEVRSRFGRVLWRIAAMFSKGSGLEERFGSLLTGSRAVIALCRPHAEELIRTCSAAERKMHIIPAPPLLRMRERENGKSRRKGRALIGLKPEDDETIVFGYFGHIYPSKGVEYLLPAFAIAKKRLAEQHVSTKLVLIGGIWDAELKTQLRSDAARLNIGDDLFWAGHCEPTELIASTYLHGVDIAVLPFDSGVRLNNSSFAVCATHGLPIITTHSQDAEPAFHQSVNTLMSEPKNSEALAENMTRLAITPNLRAKMKDAVLDLAAREFSWERVTRDTRAVLDSVVQSSRRRSDI